MILDLYAYFLEANPSRPSAAPQQAAKTASLGKII